MYCFVELVLLSVQTSELTKLPHPANSVHFKFLNVLPNLLSHIESWDIINGWGAVMRWDSVYMLWADNKVTGTSWEYTSSKFCNPDLLRFSQYYLRIMNCNLNKIKM
jgi:hypothetical protein